MIDPPMDSALWLIEDNVDPRMVSSVILTHCHADHDSGVMQKVLQEGRVTLYTTPTIFSSFVKKVSLLTGLTEVDIVELIEFIPVSIGKPVNINGARFTFQYRLHSIPTIGFEVNFKGKSVVYTSDHLNDQSVFDNLHKKGILPDGRYSELTEFDWYKDFIIHEAGVPPLHTPLHIILEKPDDVKKRLLLVHTEKEKITPESGLSISPTGLSNTRKIEVMPSVHGESVQILGLIAGLDIFHNVKFDKAGELLSIVKYRKFFPGDCIVKDGEKSKRFYIIIAGRAKLIEQGEEKAVLTSGSYFGETTIILDGISRNTIIALTELITLTIDKQDFLMFISNTPIYEKLKKLGNVRSVGSWEAIEANSIFSSMTINQKNFLELIFEHVKADEGEFIVYSEKTMEFALLWNDGTGEIVDKEGNTVRELKRGDFIGHPSYLLGEKIPEHNVIARKESTYFRIAWDSMLKYYQKNPRIFLELREIDDF
jgi:CRP-like cAMP-binding protein